MSNEIQLNRILNNIYGESSTQSFEKLKFNKLFPSSLLGGFETVKRVEPKLVYLDDNPEQKFEHKNTPDFEEVLAEEEEKEQIEGLSGGGRRRKKKGGASSNDDRTPIYASPMYVPVADMQTFVLAFNLAYAVVNSRRNAIFVLPTKDQLQTIISDYKKKIEKEGITPGTSEASQYIAANDLPFKRYIFDWKDREMEKVAYDIPENFPRDSTSIPLKRLNRASEIFYFHFKNIDQILISATEDFTKPTKLEFVARCYNNVFVLRGVIPDCKEKRPLITAHVRRNKKQATKDTFLKLLEAYDGDLDRAGYDFVGYAFLKKSKRKPKNQVVSDLVKYYSANMGHSALEILASHEYDDYFDEVYGEEQIFDAHKSLVQKFMPKMKRIEPQRAQTALQRIFDNMPSEKTINGKSLNKLFFGNLKKLYKNFSPHTLKADVATAMYLNNPTQENAEYAIDVMNAIDEDGEEFHSDVINEDSEMNSEEKSYTPLVNNVYSSLYKMPFIGAFAKENFPILPTPRRRILHEEDDEISVSKDQLETVEEQIGVENSREADKTTVDFDLENDDQIELNSRKKKKKKSNRDSIEENNDEVLYNSDFFK
jgi:hypothetical protein